MMRRSWVRFAIAAVGLSVADAWHVEGQSVSNNPYQAVHGWERLPEGMRTGVPSGAYPDPDGRHLWILTRCGANHCAGSTQDPILKLDLEGNLVDSFGAGLFSWPHGFFLDHEGFLWVTEGAPSGDPREVQGIRRGMGHQVFKLNQRGEVVMTLGVRGVAGEGPDHFNGPSAVLVTPNGEIWVADGHRGGNNRVVKFSPRGEFLLQIGGGVDDASGDPGKLNDPHDLTMDSQGRLIVADRGNNRVQLFDQQGNFLHVWTQFGRPSTVFVDRGDLIYVGDGMSDDNWNPGWERGIRIGDARTGWITAFIPDSEAPVGTGVEFLGVDFAGNIYSGEVGRERLVKYVRFRP
ncbi:MAG: peptidyl-alpha-hydroxyglycine alpha-amidating lyase family protein [Gemmatimonadota bacterium]